PRPTEPWVTEPWVTEPWVDRTLGGPNPGWTEPGVDRTLGGPNPGWTEPWVCAFTAHTLGAVWTRAHPGCGLDARTPWVRSGRAWTSRQSTMRRRRLGRHVTGRVTINQELEVREGSGWFGFLLMGPERDSAALCLRRRVSSGFEIGEWAAAVERGVAEAHHVFVTHVVEARDEHVGEGGLVLEVEQAAHLEVSARAAREHHQGVVFGMHVALAELVPMHDQRVVPQRTAGTVGRGFEQIMERDALLPQVLVDHAHFGERFVAADVGNVVMTFGHAEVLVHAVTGVAAPVEV